MEHNSRVGGSGDRQLINYKVYDMFINAMKE